MAKAIIYSSIMFIQLWTDCVLCPLLSLLSHIVYRKTKIKKCSLLSKTIFYKHYFLVETRAVGVDRS
jgi:hypothetical protein